MRIFILIVIVIMNLQACEKGGVATTSRRQNDTQLLGIVTGASGYVWKEGVHYHRLDSKPSRLGSKDAPEVIEFFSYGCPYCFMMEPHVVLAAVLQPNPFHVTLVPTAGTEERLAHARLYYTLKQLGRNDLHADVFDTIWRQGNKLVAASDSKATFVLQQAFATAHGITPASFADAYYSKEVEAELERGRALVNKYKITGIPTLVVDGTYVGDLTGVQGDEDKLMVMVQDLVLRTHEAPK